MNRETLLSFETHFHITMSIPDIFFNYYLQQVYWDPTSLDNF